MSEEGQWFLRTRLRDVASHRPDAGPQPCRHRNAMSAMVFCLLFSQGSIPVHFPGSSPSWGKFGCLPHWKTNPLSYPVLPGTNWITTHVPCTLRTSGGCICALSSPFLVPGLPNTWHVWDQGEKSQFACPREMPSLDKTMRFLSYFLPFLPTSICWACPTCSSVSFMYPFPLSVTAFCTRFPPFLHLSVTSKPVLRVWHLIFHLSYQIFHVQWILDISLQAGEIVSK